VTKIVATFSIVAFDPETDSLGVAVQSKFLAVGSVVPWARALSPGCQVAPEPGGSETRYLLERPCLLEEVGRSGYDL
jgi:hypothetical protein